MLSGISRLAQWCCSHSSAHRTSLPLCNCSPLLHIPFQAMSRLTVSTFRFLPFWQMPSVCPLLFGPFSDVAFLCFGVQHVRLQTTGRNMLWPAGFHTAMVCLCGDDGLQIRTKERLHPQRVCDQDSWHWRSAADLVSAHLENSLCLFHHRYVHIDLS